MTYEQACMDTQKEEEYMDLLQNMIEHNDRRKTLFSKEKLRKAINMIVSETEEEECNASNVTIDTFIQTPVTTNTPREKTDVANERQIYSESLTETLKGFNRLTLQSTINNSAFDHSNKNVTKSEPKSDQLIPTHTNDGKKRKITDADTIKVNSPQKILTNR